MKSMFRTLFLACMIMVVAVSSAPLSAQHKYRVSMGRAELGVNLLDLQALNGVLEDDGYAPLRSGVFAFGFAAQQFRGHLVYGGKLYNYMIAKSQFDFQLASMNYHYVIPYIGPVFYKDETEFIVYGTVGAGLGIANLKARPLGQQFHTNYNTSGLLVDVALHVSHKFTEVEGRTTGFEVGASLGYQYAPENAFVLENFGNTESGIRVAPSGLYFRLTMGMMSWQ